jgi:hypothetical protein|tara:strand:- start:532 stop:849 length:318 start_codon:yes stop_codon:yes gene_type:complete
MNKFWIYLANIVKSNMVLKPKGDLKFRTDKSIEGSSILGYLVMIHIAKDLFDKSDDEIMLELSLTKNKYRQLLGKFHREVENENKKLLTKVNLCTRHLKEMKILK